jgi:amidase
MTLSDHSNKIVRENTLGAFCDQDQISLAGRASGPLKDECFAVKDVFDIRGARTGFGNPDWLRTHPPASETAWVIRQLLSAGATMIGKTISDEMTYSLTGENAHYGTPVNPIGPDRVPGGSSSGSAVAVAGELVDFALGTDCGGSVRVPASYCGIYGIRPTHERIPLTGVVPFASSFDVVGWFARDADMLARVGSVLLCDTEDWPRPKHMSLVSDSFALVETERRNDLLRLSRELGDKFGGYDEIILRPDGLDELRETFQTLQAAEIWFNHGAWISEVKPAFGPGIRDRFERASTIGSQDVQVHTEKRERFREQMNELLNDGRILCLPTSPRAAPLRNIPIDTMEVAYRNQAMCLLSIAGLCGLPQVSIPINDNTDRPPIGLSLIGAKGTDMALLALARELSSAR